LLHPQPSVIVAVIGFAVASVVLARAVFTFGLRRYQSGNLVELRG